ncbi:MAG: M20 aminoacylase family protein [Micavibrio sp.]
MPVINRVADFKDEIAALRRSMHENPQTSYEEKFASDLVAKKLTEWGITFKRGYAVTGIVATIEGQKTDSGKTIGLRADMDALDILEKSGQEWASKIPGKMHGCGHDGHTSILLSTAKYLQETRNFNGKVHLIFQPAEEGGRGANKMLEEGVFKDFPCDTVYGLHNWPWLPFGKVETRVGPLMANVDEFTLTVKGKGGHAAYPQATIDPVVVGAQLIMALQTIVSRNATPTEPLVVSITNFNGGTGASNVIADTAILSGTVRSFTEENRQLAKKRVTEICAGIAAVTGAVIDVEYTFELDATINSAAETAFAAQCAAKVVGAENVSTETPLCMGGEDFGSFRKEKPGCYIFIGQGTKDQNSPHNQGLHSPFYDFNDDLIPVGSSYFAEIVENALPLKK